MITDLINELSESFQENSNRTSESSSSANTEETKGEVDERQPIVTIERVLSYQSGASGRSGNRNSETMKRSATKAVSPATRKCMCTKSEACVLHNDTADNPRG